MNKGFQARIEKDSIAPNGKRITTFVIKFNRYILAEINTHRAVAKNSASSRAIPTDKIIKGLQEDPFIPEVVYRNKSGMQGDELLSPEELAAWQEQCRLRLEDTIEWTQRMMEQFNIHKQTINRYLEPWMWCTQVCTATDWDNFFALRCHKDAAPEFQHIARMMWELYQDSTPKELAYGQWHLPFTDALTWDEAAKSLGWDIDDIDCDPAIEEINRRMCEISAGRCAAVSYNNLGNTERQTTEEVLKRFSKLMGGVPGHFSPCEHQATPHDDPLHVSGNLRGWHQFRKEFPNETIWDFDGTWRT